MHTPAKYSAGWCHESPFPLKSKFARISHRVKSQDVAPTPIRHQLYWIWYIVALPIYFHGFWWALTGLRPPKPCDSSNTRLLISSRKVLWQLEYCTSHIVSSLPWPWLCSCVCQPLPWERVLRFHLQGVPHLRAFSSWVQSAAICRYVLRP